MPMPVENISADLINFLKDRFEISDTVDEKGNFTDDPALTKIFSFDYINKKGEDKGCVVISLLDDSESQNSIKIYFGEELAGAGSDTRDEWYAFLQDLRKFAKMHLLGFDVRNINKAQVTRRDIEKDIQLVKEDLTPMFEGTFGPIDGTVKTSRQQLQDSDIRIVIKHSDRIDPNVRYGRSRKIERIYLVNGKGERFLMPFPSLMFARAMARHIEAGGTPYDNVGGSMCQLMDEMKVLSRFIKFVKGKIPAGDAKREEAIEAGRQQYREVKKKLSRLTSKEGYAKFHDAVPVDKPIVDDEINEDIFNGIELDEESQMALPYISRAYNKFKKVPEEGEFEKWVSAAKGEGEGQDVIMDTAVEAGCPDCPYHGEALPEFKICKQCYIDAFGKSPDDIAIDQEEAGKMAGKKDLAFLKKQNEEEDDYQPYEYGGMNGSVPTQDEIAGSGQMQFESDIYRFLNIVKEAENHTHWYERNKENPKLMTCTTCGDTQGVIYDEEDLTDEEIAALKAEEVTESQINEFLGLGKKKMSPEEAQEDAKKQFYSLVHLLTFLGFESVAKGKNNESIWKNSYYKLLIEPQWNGDKFQIRWTINRNGKNIAKGDDYVSFAKTILQHEEFRDHQAKLVKNKGRITEADVPDSSGWAGPLTFPHVYLGSKFHTVREIDKLEDTSGKLSPLSLNCAKAEKEVDDNGKKVPNTSPIGVRSNPIPSNQAPGLDNPSRW